MHMLMFSWLHFHWDRICRFLVLYFILRCHIKNQKNIQLHLRLKFAGKVLQGNSYCLVNMCMLFTFSYFIYCLVNFSFNDNERIRHRRCRALNEGEDKVMPLMHPPEYNFKVPNNELPPRKPHFKV